MPNHIDRHIGARISDLRSRKKKSVIDICDEADLEASLVMAFEAGTTRLPAGTMLELCRALCVSPEELFAGLDLPAADIRPNPPQLDDLLKARAKARN